MEWVQENWEMIGVAIGGLVYTAGAVASLTPNEDDDRIVSKVQNFVAKFGIGIPDRKKEAA